MSQSSRPERTIHIPEGAKVVGSYVVDRPLAPPYRAVVVELPGGVRLDVRVHPSVAPLIAAALAGAPVAPAELGPEQPADATTWSGPRYVDGPPGVVDFLPSDDEPMPGDVIAQVVLVDDGDDVDATVSVRRRHAAVVAQRLREVADHLYPRGPAGDAPQIPNPRPEPTP